MTAGPPEPSDGTDRMIAALQADTHLENLMPYQSVADLPKAQTDQYDPHQKEVFLKAFNNAFTEYKGDEGRAFAVAHAAAKKAVDKPPAH